MTGVIFHSDRGCQYTSRDYAELARANGVVLSVGTQGRVLGQRGGRSVLRHHQARAHRHPGLADESGLRRAVFDYIEGWYNTRRLHSTLGYLSPAQYEDCSTTTPTVRRHDQHKQPVRRTGSSPQVPGGAVHRRSARVGSALYDEVRRLGYP